MIISLFLAKVIGIYFIVLSIPLFLNTQRVKQLSTDIYANPSLLFVAGIFTLIIGILLIVSHNVWTPDWQIIITLTGWICLIKGIIRVAFPQVGLHFVNRLIQNTYSYYICAGIMLLLGILLVYKGYMQPTTRFMNLW